MRQQHACVCMIGPCPAAVLDNSTHSSAWPCYKMPSSTKACRHKEHAAQHIGKRSPYLHKRHPCTSQGKGPAHHVKLGHWTHLLVLLMLELLLQLLCLGCGCLQLLLGAVQLLLQVLLGLCCSLQLELSLTDVALHAASTEHTGTHNKRKSVACATARGGRRAQCITCTLTAHYERHTRPGATLLCL